MYQQFQLNLLLAYILMGIEFSKLKQTGPFRPYFRCFMYQQKSGMKKMCPSKMKKCTIITLRRCCPFFYKYISNCKRIYKIVFYENGTRKTELCLVQAKKFLSFFFLLDLPTFNFLT